MSVYARAEFIGSGVSAPNHLDYVVQVGSGVPFASGHYFHSALYSNGPSMQSQAKRIDELMGAVSGFIVLPRSPISGLYAYEIECRAYDAFSGDIKVDRWYTGW